MRWFVVVSIFVLLFLACRNQSEFQDNPASIRVPARFPPINFPQGNEPTELRIALGRVLFYDTRLSSNDKVHCGSCHVLSVAFTDSRSTSPGISGIPGRRNAPTLANVAWMPRFMMEGGVPSLETQALAPLHDTLEMGQNMMLAVVKLNEDEKLRALAKAAYDRDSIDPYVITRALAAFQRTFVSGDSRYDRYKQGMQDQMNEQELRGMNLFFSERTACGDCHKDVFMTDFGYYNIGLYVEYADPGKARATHEPTDIGKFKTPTLRNIALTAPYMHDGSMWSLEEVIAFYNKGGEFHTNKDERIRHLGLNENEQKDLLAFLKTLTDWNFVQNEHLLPLNR
jgi:cytochrome c peroxidase